MNSTKNSEGRCKKCNKICEDCEEPKKLYPTNQDLPFFAYGLFKNGELGFHQIKKYVERIIYCEIQGKLYERDGIPLFDEQGYSYIKGQLIFFKPGKGASAYDKIAEMEPGIIYKWQVISVNEQCANILHGKNTDKDSDIDDKSEWSGKNDPFFNKKFFDLIRSIHDEWSREPEPSTHSNFNFEPTLRLQMAYLLLWSAIERYISLKYGFAGKSISSKLNEAREEDAFKEGLKIHVKENRQVFRSDRESVKKKVVTLNPNNHIHSMNYYYTVRSNATHRGKAVGKDYGILKKSLEELLNIFELMLKESFRFDESFGGKKFS